MSVGQGQMHEAHFGPISELIDVSEFLQAVQPQAGSEDSAQCSVSSQSSSDIAGDAKEEWLQLPESTRRAIEEECSMRFELPRVVHRGRPVRMQFVPPKSMQCVKDSLHSVEDIRTSLNNVIVNPQLMAHVTRTHDASVQAIYETADMSNRKKRKRVTVVDPDQEKPEVTVLRRQLEQIQLKSWPLYLNSALFIRTSRHSDSNTLTSTKRLAFSPVHTDQNQALLFVTVYDRLQWGHRLIARSSQHVLLSSQSLGDLMESIPCVSNEIPQEQTNEQGIVTWQKTSPANSSGSVICVEGVVYGDGQTENDYSDKLLDYLKALADGQPLSVKKGPAMHDVTFLSLKTHLHQPYWLLHVGDCEHFFVIDQIRLRHPSDPPLKDYPLTTQITPPLLDTCRACNKVPAVYSILGDIRLGESPFVICSSCWRWMGMPQGEAAQQVTVVPLPLHELGWSG